MRPMHIAARPARSILTNRTNADGICVIMKARTCPHVFAIAYKVVRSNSSSKTQRVEAQLSHKPPVVTLVVYECHQFLSHFFVLCASVSQAKRHDGTGSQKFNVFFASTRSFLEVVANHFKGRISVWHKSAAPVRDACKCACVFVRVTRRRVWCAKRVVRSLMRSKANTYTLEVQTPNPNTAPAFTLISSEYLHDGLQKTHSSVHFKCKLLANKCIIPNTAIAMMLIGKTHKKISTLLNPSRVSHWLIIPTEAATLSFPASLLRSTHVGFPACPCVRT